MPPVPPSDEANPTEPVTREDARPEEDPARETEPERLPEATADHLAERTPESPAQAPADQAADVPADRPDEVRHDARIEPGPEIEPVELDPGSWYLLAYTPSAPASVPPPARPAPPATQAGAPEPTVPVAPAPAAAAMPSAPAAAPAPGMTPQAAAPREPGVLGDDESSPRAANEALVVRPGRTLARPGLQVRTSHLRLDSTTRLFAAPRDPVVRVKFGRNGRVLLAEFVEGKSTGNPAIDKPLLDSLHRWSASGEDLLRLATDDPDAGLTLVFRIDF